MNKAKDIIKAIIYSSGFMLLTMLFYGCEGDRRIEGESSKEPPRTEIKKELYDNTLPGEDGIKGAIRGYNQVVIDGNMKSSELSRLHKFATSHEEARVISFVEESRKNNSVMRSKLERLVFNNISVGGDAATASTDETWLYDYVDFEGKLIAPVSEHHYILKYELTMFRGTWLVSSLKEIEPERVKKIEPPRPLYK